MSAREFKPGDLLRDSDGTTYFAIEVTANTRTAWRDGFHAVRADGNGYAVAGIEDARRLVVIDPDRTEQAEHLGRLLWHMSPGANWGVPGGEPYKQFFDDVQAALREFAAPSVPKPEEPLGLGAVVVDAEGVRWVRASKREDFAWRCARVDDAAIMASWSPWADIDAVTVLSEGVSDV